MIKYILASGSPRRKEILTNAGISFDIIVSECEEQTNETRPDKLVMSLSKLKCNAVAQKIILDKEILVKLKKKMIEDNAKKICVIGADTMVFNKDLPMGKPSDEASAYTMLKSLQGTNHSVYTGVCLTFLSLNEFGCFEINHSYSFAEKTIVYVAAMSDNEINEYIKTGESLDKAGAYGIQGYFSKYIERIEGDYFNVVGFPICRFSKELSKILN